MPKRRPYAVMIYKDGRRHFYGFATRPEAEQFRNRHLGGMTVAEGKVSPVIHLGTRR